MSSDFMTRVPRPLIREMIVFSANDLGEIRYMHIKELIWTLIPYTKMDSKWIKTVLATFYCQLNTT